MKKMLANLEWTLAEIKCLTNIYNSVKETEETARKGQHMSIAHTMMEIKIDVDLDIYHYIHDIRKALETFSDAEDARLYKLAWNGNPFVTDARTSVAQVKFLTEEYGIDWTLDGDTITLA